MSIATRLAPLVFKPYYSLTSRFASDDFVFLNMSYEENPPMGLPLDPADEPNRYFINFYHAVATQNGDLAGKRVLEVSCGQGGGASYLTRTFRPDAYAGLDRNRAGIEFCRRRHQLPGLGFVHGDAQRLPFPDQSFDAVINIEASTHYPDFPRFLAEVARVLTPGGRFLYADVRPAEQIPAWEADLAACPLRIVSWRDISDDVARGMEHNAQLKAHNMRYLPAPIAKRYVANACQSLRSEAGSYRMYCLARHT
ncbi:phthiotriol/phenolphthiotriol dimycocerosates methyltransferase [Mycobacterium sp. MFM001]|uniref:phthiotriol/phenolphthiotriol dimycocerosates methyltransferase n=1 Tax=Mycobacterium sp. MFM001 TaxID=2049453 RepID=UPI000DA584D9|nr:class I SAM-dependent methyltransferase [Mycobacterium sp. MFM001]GBE68197.1 phthiotriol/phenolphthiotriol dimycocerosates methyltransferase [Mycobacterium sp. MFM001]